ncbi:MAG: TlpA disulfide reductase family protein [Balneolales bacterium]
MKTSFYTLLIILLIGQTQFSCAQASNSGDNKEEVIDNAVFTDLDGTELTVSDFEGKIVLVDVWETWCAPCIASMPTLHDLAENYSADFMVVALSPNIMDSPEQVEEFVDNHDYNFTYVYGRQFAADMEVQSIPHKIFIGPDGKYLTTIVGSHGPEEDYIKIKDIIEANRLQ